MRRTVLLAIAICAFSAAVAAQQDPLEWFPLQIGNRWVYEHEWKSGDRNQPEVDRWTTEESVTALIHTADGLVVLREVHTVPPQSKSHTAQLTVRDRAPYLLKGNCIYVMAEGWDSATRQLRPEYRKYLNASAVSPDFCFPLQTGREWGNPDISWRVEPAHAPAGYPEAIHISSSHFGSGGKQDVWVQKGVGVVATHYLHSGTYDEYTRKLVSFSH